MEGIVRRLVEQALGGDIQAATEVLSRTLGRPTESDLLERLERLEHEKVDHERLAEFLGAPIACCRPEGRRKKATSVNALRTSLRMFFAYMDATGYLPTNPARLIRRARCGPRPPRGLPQADQDRLLDVLRREDAGRDHALFHLMLATGIRVGAAVSLRVEDVDLDQGEIWPRRSKGDRCGKVVLGPGILDHLRRYMDGLAPGPLFSGRPGKTIGTRHAGRRPRRRGPNGPRPPAAEGRAP